MTLRRQEYYKPRLAGIWHGPSSGRRLTVWRHHRSGRTARMNIVSYPILSQDRQRRLSLREMIPPTRDLQGRESMAIEDALKRQTNHVSLATCTVYATRSGLKLLPGATWHFTIATCALCSVILNELQNASACEPVCFGRGQLPKRGYLSLHLAAQAHRNRIPRKRRSETGP